MEAKVVGLGEMAMGTVQTLGYETIRTYGVLSGLVVICYDPQSGWGALASFALPDSNIYAHTQERYPCYFWQVGWPQLVAQLEGQSGRKIKDFQIRLVGGTDQVGASERKIESLAATLVQCCRKTFESAQIAITAEEIGTPAAKCVGLNLKDGLTSVRVGDQIHTL